ncbi:hypothetical protein IIA79_03485 [bacterium]|nr:hypothetical protein [bacterium]
MDASRVVEMLPLFVMLVLLAAALWTFITVQIELNDPSRRQRNEEWFEKFEAYIRLRYRDPELAWRVRDLGAAFSRAASRNGRQ